MRRALSAVAGSFPQFDSRQFFLEGRYHYVLGGRVEGPRAEPLEANRDEKATGQDIKIRSGFRFQGGGLRRYSGPGSAPSDGRG